jgi:hypothetical protein
VLDDELELVGGGGKALEGGIRSEPGTAKEPAFEEVVLLAGLAGRGPENADVMDCCRGTGAGSDGARGVSGV